MQRRDSHLLHTSQLYCTSILPLRHQLTHINRIHTPIINISTLTQVLEYCTPPSYQLPIPSFPPSPLNPPNRFTTNPTIALFPAIPCTPLSTTPCQVAKRGETECAHHRAPSHQFTTSIHHHGASITIPITSHSGLYHIVSSSRGSLVSITRRSR